MKKISRRSVMQGLLAGGAAAVASGPLSWSIRRAIAQEMPTIYPTIFITMRGGLDVAMHFDAKLGLVNRDSVISSRINQTAHTNGTGGLGVRWFEDTLSSLRPFMEDAVVIRNIDHTSSHKKGLGIQWYGEGDESRAANATPWANYLASELIRIEELAGRPAPVAAPNLTIYEDNEDPIRQFVDFNNQSPDPRGAAQRVTDIAAFTSSLDVFSGLPTIERQKAIYAHVAAADSRTYSPAVQSKIISGFSAANNQADELLNQEPLPPLWPPSSAVRDIFNLSDSDLVKTVDQGNPLFKTGLAFAFQMVSAGASHVVSVMTTQSSYDTHSDNDRKQRERSAYYVPAIASLLSALRSTENPSIPGTSLYDTTNVVITSELSRANAVDDFTGTPHWGWTQAVAFGGNFKRGYGFGTTNGDLVGQPADFVTGAAGGQVTTWHNIAATILKAAGVRPGGWTGSASIDAVLRR